MKVGWNIIQHFNNRDLQSRKFKFVLQIVRPDKDLLDLSEKATIAYNNEQTQK